MPTIHKTSKHELVILNNRVILVAKQNYFIREAIVNIFIIVTRIFFKNSL